MTAIQAATTQTVSTPDGAFTLITDVDGRLLAAGWTAQHESLLPRIHPNLRPTETVEGGTQAAEAVTAYYEGDTAAVTAVPTRQHGTELQQRGWAALKATPAGRTMSYTEFATAIGNAAASRAAASICARNAVGLFVPCHRVLRSDGQLGGFAWGTSIKRSLLDRESRM